MKLTVGAYPAYPTTGTNPVALTREFLEGLSQDPAIGGFEIPFAGYNQAEYRNGTWPKGAAPDAHIVLTGIPGTLAAQAEDPHFGLASRNDAGRETALRFVRGLNARARMLVAQGYDVRAVLIQSAPSNTGTIAAFAASLREITSWDWYGVSVIVEHCDSAGGRTRPQKAYLELNEEIAAIQSLNHDTDERVIANAHRVRLGIAINWARSVIETGERAGAIAHINLARTSGMLRGLTFCGVSPVANSYGPAWEDAHMPPAGIGVDSADSMLTVTDISGALQAAGTNLLFCGCKVALRPNDLSVPQRIAHVHQITQLIAAASK